MKALSFVVFLILFMLFTVPLSGCDSNELDKEVAEEQEGNEEERKEEEENKYDEYWEKADLGLTEPENKKEGVIVPGLHVKDYIYAVEEIGFDKENPDHVFGDESFARYELIIERNIHPGIDSNLELSNYLVAWALYDEKSLIDSPDDFVFVTIPELIFVNNHGDWTSRGIAYARNTGDNKEYVPDEIETGEIYALWIDVSALNTQKSCSDFKYKGIEVIESFDPNIEELYNFDPIEQELYIRDNPIGQEVEDIYSYPEELLDFYN